MPADSLDEHFLQFGRGIGEQEGDNLRAVRILTDGDDRRSAAVRKIRNDRMVAGVPPSECSSVRLLACFHPQGKAMARACQKKADTHFDESQI